MKSSAEQVRESVADADTQLKEQLTQNRKCTYLLLSGVRVYVPLHPSSNIFYSTFYQSFRFKMACWELGKYSYFSPPVSHFSTCNKPLSWQQPSFLPDEFFERDPASVLCESHHGSSYAYSANGHRFKKAVIFLLKETST